jgi:putative ABC transport system permease protein
LHNSFSLSVAATGFSDTGDQYKKALFLLMAIVGVVLLVACSNIANLLLSRASARQREISVRMAMGANRPRIIRQLLTESLLLSIFGAGGGFLLAMWGSKLLIRLISTTGNQLEINLSPDWHLITFTVAIAILTTLLFGLAPAFRATRIGLSQVLKENVSGAIQGSTRFNFGKALLAGQIALSLILLIGAFLFLGTLRNLLNIDLGFSRRNILLVNANIGQTTLLKTQHVQLYRDILDHLRRIPTVGSASCSFITPISGRSWNSRTYPEGFTAKSREDTLVWLNRISSGFFTTMQTPLLLGRDFNERDTPNSPRVMIINESAARHFFGKAYPIGKTIGMDKPGTPGGTKDIYQVVGIVKDAKYVRMEEATPKTAYLACSQDLEPKILMSYEIRWNGAGDSLIPSIRSVIAEINRDVSLEFRNFETQVNESLLQPRVVALLSSIFGLLALLMSVVGLYGVTSYSVARRKREIGIRIALGSPPWSVVWLMLRDMALLLTIGTVIGLGISLALGRLIRSLLYGVQPNDPMHLAGATIILAIAAVLAAYLPARQAVRLDPMKVLRDE